MRVDHTVPKAFYWDCLIAQNAATHPGPSCSPQRPRLLSIIKKMAEMAKQDVRFTPLQNTYVFLRLGSPGLFQRTVSSLEPNCTPW